MTTPSTPDQHPSNDDDAADELQRLRRQAFRTRIGDVDEDDRQLQQQLLREVRTFLTIAPHRPRMLARAQLLQDIVLAFYDHAKFNEYGGEGRDGMDGPERRAIGQVSDAARSWTSELLAAKRDEDGQEHDDRRHSDGPGHLHHGGVGSAADAAAGTARPSGR